MTRSPDRAARRSAAVHPKRSGQDPAARGAIASRTAAPRCTLHPSHRVSRESIVKHLWMTCLAFVAGTALACPGDGAKNASAPADARTVASAKAPQTPAPAAKAPADKAAATKVAAKSAAEPRKASPL